VTSQSPWVLPQIQASAPLSAISCFRSEQKAGAIALRAYLARIDGVLHGAELVFRAEL
jgi:hypothetical protein